MPGTDALLGKLVGTSYQLVRKIGAGGMGAVYEAKHVQQGTRAAVKVLNRELAQDTTLLERFRREASITASLTNPHTVKVFGFDQPENGLPYMVMEYLEGEDLETRLKRVQRLTAPQAQEMLRCLSIALSEAHGAGVIHRDLKPANIFYAKEGSGERVKLLDFGLSKAMNVGGEGLTFMGQLLGTIWYMSPEQTRGQEATVLSDVYSVGVVLYQALTGALPFSADNPHEYLYRVQTAAPRPLKEVAPDLPAALEPILLCAMAREPAERFGSVRQLHDAFAGIFSMGNDSTSMSKVPVEVRAKSMPPSPRTATDPKLRVTPAKTNSDPGTRSPSPRITASRPAIPVKALSDPDLKVSPRPPPPSAPPPSRTLLSMQAQDDLPTPAEAPAISDATVVRPLMAPPEGDAHTYVAPGATAEPDARTYMGVRSFEDEGSAGTVVRPVLPPPEGDAHTYVASKEMLAGDPPVPDYPDEGATRVAAVPPPPASPRSSGLNKIKMAPVVRPQTDPDDGMEMMEPERTVPGNFQSHKPLRRPAPDVDSTSPGGDDHPNLATNRQLEASGEDSGSDVAEASEDSGASPNAAMLGFGIGAALGIALLVGAIVWRLMH